MTIDPRFIVDLHGKQYITHEGLLSLAHEAGLKAISTDLISYQGVGKEAVVQATAEGEKGTYTGLGDASPQNVGKNIATATLRMAETRAVNRALRAYLGIGMTTFEEMPPDEPAARVSTPSARPAAVPARTSFGMEDNPPCPKCSGPTKKTKRWEDPTSRAPWFSCIEYDWKTKQGCRGGVWELPEADPQVSQDEMDSLDAADRYDDSPDYSTEDPPF
mgnify:CR=1 FL=1